MRVVVADTSPINYLVLIGKAALFLHLFERVIIPTEVYEELTSPHAPEPVRKWIAQHPFWLEVRETPDLQIIGADNLDRGERAAIKLALSLMADLLLMDDRKGATAAEYNGLQVTGTLGILDLAAEQGLAEFTDAARVLESTNFRRPAKLLEALLKKHQR